MTKIFTILDANLQVIKVGGAIRQVNTNLYSLDSEEAVESERNSCGISINSLEPKEIAEAIW